MLAGDSYKKESVDTIMAAALPSYITFWTDLRNLPDAVVQRAATWLSFYKRFRDDLSQQPPQLHGPRRHRLQQELRGEDVAAAVVAVSGGIGATAAGVAAPEAKKKPKPKVVRGPRGRRGPIGRVLQRQFRVESFARGFSGVRTRFSDALALLSA